MNWNTNSRVFPVSESWTASLFVLNSAQGNAPAFASRFFRWTWNSMLSEDLMMIISDSSLSTAYAGESPETCLGYQSVLTQGRIQWRSHGFHWADESMKPREVAKSEEVITLGYGRKCLRFQYGDGHHQATTDHASCVQEVVLFTQNSAISTQQRLNIEAPINVPLLWTFRPLPSTNLSFSFNTYTYICFWVIIWGFYCTYWTCKRMLFSKR